MKVPLAFYLDTNIIRDLSENRRPRSAQKTEFIKEAIGVGKVVIAPSFEVLYELLSAPDACAATRITNAQFYDDIVNWKYALKSSDWIIRDDIASLAHNKGPSSPYCPIDEKQSDFIRSLRAGNSILPQGEWKQVVNETLNQNKRFVNKVFNDFVRRLPQNGKTKLKNYPKKTWQEWWAYGGLAEIIASSLDTSGLVRGRYSLLVLPTVRAAVGYILHTWFQQVVNGAKLKPTTHYDFRNAVIAGGIGKIVTQDKKLRNAINNVTDLNVKAWTLDEFIKEVT